MPVSSRRRPPARRRVPIVSLLIGLALGACSTIPEVDVPSGSRVEVRLYDAERGITLRLANASHPGLHDVYSEPRADGSLKLAPDELVGQLLASLERAGFDDFAVPAAAPAPAAGARGSALVVGRGDAWSRWEEPGPAASQAERRAFAHCKLILNEYYSHVGGLQFIENPEGHRGLREQRVEIGA